MADVTINLTDMNTVINIVTGMEADILSSQRKSSPKCPSGRWDR
jgi:hypothetical protein